MEDPNSLPKILNVQLAVPILIDAMIGTRWSSSDVGGIA